MVAINVVGSKYLSAHLQVLTVLFYRFGIATLFLLLLCLLSPEGMALAKIRQLKQREWVYIILQGLGAGAFFNGLMLLGLQYTDAAIAGMIISVLPAIIAFGAVIFLRERLSPITLVATFAAVSGLMIINGQHLHAGAHGYLLGDAIILLALVPEAAYFVLSRFYHNPLPRFHLSLVMNGVNCLALTPLMFLSGISKVFAIDKSSLEVVLVTGIASAFFYVFWSMGAKEIPASKASIFTAMGPLLISVIAYFVLGEDMTLVQLLGMALIITSVLASSQSQRA